MKRFVVFTLMMLLMISGCKKNDTAGSAAGQPDSSAQLSGSSADRFVSEASGLRMRDKPDVTGNKIDSIPYGSKVTFISEQAEKVTISGTSGKWTKISWNGKEGWAFGGFLASDVKIPMPADFLGTWVSPDGGSKNVFTINSVVFIYVYGPDAMDHSIYDLDSITQDDKYTVLHLSRTDNKSETRLLTLRKAGDNLAFKTDDPKAPEVIMEQKQ